MYVKANSVRSLRRHLKLMLRVLSSKSIMHILHSKEFIVLLFWVLSFSTCFSCKSKKSMWGCVFNIMQVIHEPLSMGADMVSRSICGKWHINAIYDLRGPQGRGIWICSTMPSDTMLYTMHGLSDWKSSQEKPFFWAYLHTLLPIESFSKKVTYFYASSK